MGAPLAAVPLLAPASEIYWLAINRNDPMETPLFAKLRIISGCSLLAAKSQKPSVRQQQFELKYLAKALCNFNQLPQDEEEPS